MSEVFRRRLIGMFVDRKLFDDQFACNLKSWKHFGFSIDNSVRIMDQETQESLWRIHRKTSHFTEEDPL